MTILWIITLITNQLLLFLVYKRNEEIKGWRMLADHTANELQEIERELWMAKSKLKEMHETD